MRAAGHAVNGRAVDIQPDGLWALQSLDSMQHVSYALYCSVKVLQLIADCSLCAALHVQGWGPADQPGCVDGRAVGIQQQGQWPLQSCANMQHVLVSAIPCQVTDLLLNFALWLPKVGDSWSNWGLDGRASGG